MEFEGFEDPKENWSKLPHALIGALPLVETVGELKIILYILRHTWGFHDDQKKITLDEFANGRKRKDGSRLDCGTGLTIPTIRDGIKRAVKHGFIIHTQDAKDKARVKNFYTLKMRGEKLLHAECKKDSVGMQNSLPRSEKETLDRNNKIDKGGAKNSADPTYLPEAEDQLPNLFPRAQGNRDYEQAIKDANWRINNTDHRQAMALWLEASRLDVPFDKSARGDWLKSIDLHLKSYSVEQLKFLYPRVVAEMRGDRITVSRPGSVTSNLADFVARERSGNNGNRNANQSRGGVRGSSLSDDQKAQLGL